MDDQTLTYPKGRVVGIAADRATVDAVKDGLAAADVDRADIEVMCGDQGEDELDPDTGGGALGDVVRVVQKALGEEAKRMEHLSDAVEAGAFVVTVDLPDEDDDGHDQAKQRAAEALISSGATSVAYYGEWQIEELQIGA